MGFDQTQNKSLDELGRKLVHAVNSIREDTSSGMEPLDPGNAELANTFGVLGPRGAGKSTILRGLYERRSNLKVNRRFKELLLLPPLDCSVIVGDVAAGAAVLLHLEDHLKSRETPAGKKAAVADILKRLETLAGRYSKTTDPFRSLGVELASSLGDYTHFVLSGMRDRFHLREDLSTWLTDALETFGVEAFVVLLDDFDLVHADEVRKWILSLLDELHQKQLLFVLTADFYRLEHLSWDPKAEFDDKTGRALLEKLLPAQNRLNLEPWGQISRKAFLDLDQGIQPFVPYSPIQESLLKRLLPGLPRGLVNLHRSLKEDLPLKCENFLSLLASCRGEPLLARELKETPLGSWARTLQFSHRDLSVEEWQETVEAAARRGLPDSEQGDGELRPLFGLMPVLAPPSPLTSLQEERTGQRPRSAEVHVVEQAAVYDSLRRDPSWQHPLRHDDLYIRPLRDAQEYDQPYWTELLLNFAFSLAGKDPEAVRNRVYFLEAWTPAVSRLKRAQFHVELTRRALRELFEDAEPEIPRAALLWMHWKLDEIPQEAQIVNFGWHPLLSGLRGARDPLLSRQLADLMINPAELGGDLPEIGNAKELMLIPNHLGDMILLTEGLDRCPWNAFSTPLAWLVRTYISLAAAFVRTAYAFALKASGALAHEELSQAQQRMVAVLERRDPLNLLRLREDEVLAWIAEMFADDLRTKLEKAEAPLSRAALAFLSSPVYTSVLSLLPEAFTAGMAGSPRAA